MGVRLRGDREDRWGYAPRRPEETVLYGLVAANLETFLVSALLRK